MPKPDLPKQHGLQVSDSFTAAETDMLLEIMRAGGFATPAGAIRCGLWKLAQHFDLDCPPELFRLLPSQVSRVRHKGGRRS